MMTASKAWLMLMLAIAFEMTGTSVMKYFSVQGNMTGYIYMMLFIGFSYYALSKAVLIIPISTAYAVWEGVGLIGTAFIAWLIFGEVMSVNKITAFAFILTGLFMLKKGTRKEDRANE